VHVEPLKPVLKAPRIVLLTLTYDKLLSNFPFIFKLRRYSGVYHDMCTRRILVTEWIDGTKLSECPQDEIRELIGIGQECFLVQLLQVGRGRTLLHFSCQPDPLLSPPPPQTPPNYPLNTPRTPPRHPLNTRKHPQTPLKHTLNTP
jgi:hypothetical protein